MAETCPYFVGPKVSENCERCGNPFHEHVREWSLNEPIRPWKKSEIEETEHA